MTIKKSKAFEYKISSFEFSHFDENILDGEIKPFEIQEIDNIKGIDSEKNHFDPDVEYNIENDTGFKIEEIVREYRDVRKHEESKMNQKIDQLAEKQVSSIKDQAYKVGETQGREKAYEDALLEYQDGFNKRLEKIDRFIESINEEKSNIINSFHKNILNLIQSCSKWMVLKEVDQEEYVGRLLEKLILEVDSFQNLLIKIDKKNFQNHEGLLEEVEKKVGSLKNIRVEVLQDTHFPGVSVESDKTILDGSLEQQFQNLDNIAEDIFGKLAE
jgi:flagellar assembly protein FliH